MIRSYDPRIDDKDRLIILERSARLMRAQPLVGDFVRLPNGEMKRIAHVWNDSIQMTLGIGGASFYLSEVGGSFSGGLERGIPREQFRLLDEAQYGSFWIFHHGIRTAHNGVHFQVPCKVWELREF